MIHWLLLSMLATDDAAKPRPCRAGVTVAVAADTTIEKVGAPDDAQIISWDRRSRGPEYPAELRALGGGRVRARFVVDTAGRVMQGTATILEESHREFGRSVCRFLEQAQFVMRPPNGRPQTVEVADAPFAFSIGR